MEIEGKRVGLLVFKSSLQSEDTILNTKNDYVELKSFFLFDEFGRRSFYKYKTWDIINFLNAHSRISKQITRVVLYKDIKTFLKMNDWKNVYLELKLFKNE